MPDNAKFPLLRSWYWLVWCISIIILLASIYIFVPGFWQSPLGCFLLFIDLLALPIFWVLREILRRKGREKTWRENKWIIVPTTVIVLFFATSLLASVYLKESDFRLEAKDYPAGACVLQTRTPFIVFYKDASPQRITLQLRCTPPDISSEIVFSAEPGTVLFADSPDSSNWKAEISAHLRGDNSDTTLYLRREDDFGAEITITLGGVGTNQFALKLEDLDEAKTRLFLASLFQWSGTLISLIGIAIAGFKQVEEQKHNQRRNEVDALIKKLTDFKYENGKIEALVAEILSELDDWGAWEQEQKDRFVRAYKEFTTVKVSETQWWQDAAQAQTRFISIALAIADEVFSGQYKPPILIEIQQKLPSYRPERAAVYFPPEIYPLDRQFRQQPGEPYPEPEASERWGVPLWEMRFAPFGDGSHPFQYWQNREGDQPRQFPLLDELKFPLTAERLGNQTYCFSNAWDLRAALYRYCRSWFDRDNPDLLAIARQTFFVPVLSDDLPPWQAGLCPESYLLHGLAGAWLRALAHNPYLIDKHTPVEQDLLASLLLWRYRHTLTIKNAFLEQAERSAIPLSPPPGFLQLLEKAGPLTSAELPGLTSLLALRPRDTDQTLFLCAETSLAGRADPAFSVYLRALPDQADIPRVFLARFLLKTRRDAWPALTLDTDRLIQFLDSRIRLSHSPRLTFDGLFYPPPTREMLETFVASAGGSPGILVQKAHDLLCRHLAQAPDDPDIPPEALLE